MKTKALIELLTFIEENQDLSFQDFSNKLLEKGLTIKYIILSLNNLENYSNEEKELANKIRKILRDICLKETSKSIKQKKNKL